LTKSFGSDDFLSNHCRPLLSRPRSL